jgi:lipid-binding SYLF domain-containing protein
MTLPAFTALTRNPDERRAGRRRVLAGLAAPCLALALPAGAAAATRAEKQADVRKAANDTLARLYRSQPSAKKAVESAAGYAVFSNFGMKIFVAGGGTGQGVAVATASKAETFMKMVEVQAGLGIGVKKFRLVWVFERKSDFDNFVNSGWELGGQATAAAKVGGQGAALYAGAMSVSPGVWVYQLTDEGVAAELTVKGTKYYKDSDLN